MQGVSQITVMSAHGWSTMQRSKVRGELPVSKATARSTEKSYHGESQSELDETVPLPLLPGESSTPTEAANDTEFLLSDKAAIESLDRLVKLAESIVKRLDHISEAIATSKSISPSDRKKESRTKK